jgi:hypothetical protein
MLTYDCPAWEFAADGYLLKLQRPQNRALHTIGNLPSHTPIGDFHRSFKIPYLYDYVTQLCREQASVIRNYENVVIHTIGQGEGRHRKYKRLKLGGGQAYDRSIVETVVVTVNMYNLQRNLLYESGLRI